MTQQLTFNTLIHANALTEDDLTTLKEVKATGDYNLIELCEKCNLSHKLYAVAAYQRIPREKVVKFTGPRMYCLVETYLSINGVMYPAGFPDKVRTELGMSFSTAGIYRWDLISKAVDSLEYLLIHANRDLMGEE